MVEHRRFGNLLPHLVLLIGVAIVAFPVYLAVIASTHDNAVIANGQMPLYPGLARPREPTGTPSSPAPARPRASRSAA